MKSEATARIYRFVLIAGAILMVAAASAKMINSRLATGDMEAYLHGARSILLGQNIYAAPSRPVEQGGLNYIYPPLLAVLFIPLALLPAPVAIVLWSVFNLFLLIWIVREIYAGMTGVPFSADTFDERWALVFFALLPPSRFILHHFFYGQANLLVMALTILGLKQLKGGKPLRGALAVGLPIAVKVMTYPIGFWFLVRRNLKVVAGIAAGAAIGLLLPAAVLGFATNLDYLIFWFTEVVLAGGVNASMVPLSVNVSAQAQLHRFFGDAAAFVFQGRPHYLTIVRLPDSMLYVMEYLLTPAMLGIIALYAYKFRNAAELVSHWGGMALILGLASVFTPFAQKHYLVLLIPAFVFLARVWRRTEIRDRRFRILVIASAVLLILTNEELCGDYLGAVFAGMGATAWGALLACAAIFRAAACLEDPTIPPLIRRSSS